MSAQAVIEQDHPHRVRPFNELRDTGLLWLINRVVFHPRGYAIGLNYEGVWPDMGECTGWVLYGDGTEPWSMGDPSPEQQAQGAPTGDELFARVSALLATRDMTTRQQGAT